MALQPFSQTTARFAQLATSGLLVIQATIATTAISAFVSTNSGWMSASAQEAPSTPTPGSISTSAADLEPSPITTDCSTVFEIPIRLPHCSSEVLSGSKGGTQLGPDLGVLRDAERQVNGTVYPYPEIFSDRDSIGIRIVFPLP